MLDGIVHGRLSDLISSLDGLPPVLGGLNLPLLGRYPYLDSICFLLGGM